ncbi:MAG: GNAT family N-acetyltransferase [Beijerinckiaceae bacterium]
MAQPVAIPLPARALLRAPAASAPGELLLRAVRPADGDALQTYVRNLASQSRYNRFFGAAAELPPTELARAISANDRDRITLLLVYGEHGMEEIVGEARIALSCDQLSGEFGMSLADSWRNMGLGSALLRKIEERAAADGIETLFADTLRTNESMIGLARARGYRIVGGYEPRALRITKRLENVAPDLPCARWSERAKVYSGA